MTIKLNVEQWSVGSNMKGQDVPCKVVCVSFKEDGRPVFKTGGILLIGVKDEIVFDSRKECLAFIKQAAA